MVIQLDFICVYIGFTSLKEQRDMGIYHDKEQGQYRLALILTLFFVNPINTIYNYLLS
jgi:hypothetical protein